MVLRPETPFWAPTKEERKEPIREAVGHDGPAPRDRGICKRKDMKGSSDHPLEVVDLLLGHLPRGHFALHTCGGLR